MAAEDCRPSGGVSFARLGLGLWGEELYTTLQGIEEDDEWEAALGYGVVR